MEITGRDFERIRRENLHVRVTDFARLWWTAEQRADALAAGGGSDWYLAGVQITCRWLAHSFVTFDYPSGPVRQAAHAPITRTRSRAYEELIELETQAAEGWAGREWPGRPGFVEGVMATLAWTWRGSGVPPIEVERANAS
jgi:hypothetical protein